MTLEVTDDDRAMAKDLLAAFSDEHAAYLLAQYCAAHRQAAERKVVEWLRRVALEQGGTYRAGVVADAIERREHRK